MTMCSNKQFNVDMACVSPLISEVLASGNSVELTVSGNSMRPLLTHRVSRVRLSATDRFQIGDVVFYQRDSGAFVLHRIVKRTGLVYTMRGDNQIVAEPGIRHDQILAVMTGYSRDGIHWHETGHVPYVLYRVYWIHSWFLRRLLRAVKRRIANFRG